MESKLLAEKTMKTSLFLVNYNNKQPPQFQHELFAAVISIIKEYCIWHNIEQEKGKVFFTELQKEAFDNRNELLEEVTSACVRLWTSGKNLNGREFCSIFNESIRMDDEKCMDDITLLCRGINNLCVTRNKFQKNQLAQ